jgi:integrase
MATLNQRHLDGLKHLNDAREYSRTENGLRLVLGRKPSKLKSWELTYYLFAQKRRFIFAHYPAMGLADARSERDRLKALVKKGICPKEQAAREVLDNKLTAQQRTTFKDLRIRFDIDHLQRKGRKSRGEIIRVLETKFGSWDKLEPSDVSRMMIDERLDQIEKDGPVIRNRSHSYLRSMLSFAVKKSIVETNQATGIDRIQEHSKKRRLSDDEIRYFWQEIGNQRYSDSTVIALRLMLVTGQRGGEILTMKRSHIDGDWWTQPDTKNGLEHRTFLVERAKSLIDWAISISANNHYVFGSGKHGHMPVATLSKALKRWKERPTNPMTITAFTPHDLRRTMASSLGNMEVSRFAQNQILNHVDRSIGGVYDLSDYDQLKKRTMPLWESRLTSILENWQDDNVVAIHG